MNGEVSKPSPLPNDGIWRIEKIEGHPPKGIVVTLRRDSETHLLALSPQDLRDIAAILLTA